MWFRRLHQRYRWYTLSRILKLKQFKYALVLLVVIYVPYWYYFSYVERFWNPQHPNYFFDPLSNGTGYIVDTKSCKIPNLTAWDPAILQLISESSSSSLPVDCYASQRHWTFVDGANLNLNLTAISEDGYSLNTIRCCYREIVRVKQKITDYDMEADAVVRISEECFPLHQEINPLAAEFVRVKCLSLQWPLYRDVVYRNHHALAQWNRSETTAAKLELWREDENEKPPNVLILGIDSMSNLNFQRTMARTREVLVEIGAYEMKGYTKVGENTFPNAVAFLTGFEEGDLLSVCNYTAERPHDPCPYIWKEFNRAGYLTAHVEDAPGIQAFSRLKVGFVEQHVDFYLRPFMLDVWGALHAKDCIGHKTVDQTVFSYLESIANLSQKTQVPYFAFTWLTNLAHRDLNAPKHADEYYEKFLKSLDLTNTILFFMSDHGFRYGSFRETFYGWFEDKLPNFWVYLPPMLSQRFPSWQRALAVNSGRLLSPFDLYHTLSHILKELSPAAKKLEMEGEIQMTNSGFYRNYGASMFKPAPLNRTCSDAGIPVNYCPCATPKTVPLDSPELAQAAHTALEHINSNVPSQCAELKLKLLTAGAVVGTLNNNGTSEGSYVITFTTEPGSFLFEATVERSPEGAFRMQGNVLRMNKISTDVSCVQDAELEKLCYCRG